MLAFHAARAPQRVRVTVNTAVPAAADDCAVGQRANRVLVPVSDRMAGMFYGWLSEDVMRRRENQPASSVDARRPAL